ncbi:ribosomal RNA processing protein 1 homolog [Coffea eugenioides]|uniref:Uncharacterized protein n=1 Tax=Coffea arabica TaxID=13443 RepID=A0A6P6SZC2_COFAR|nr:ribosomal RNA processing protein 1 homolog [Coffea arabica]XP_027175380.1 ribosomal RNA processing protein 1 homolog [Coffea eugenioides]
MKKKPRTPKPKPFLATLSALPGPSLIKHLASCNASIRSQSLKLIQAWLSDSQTELPEDDMKRLWKGLFYCLWHSDKAPAQGLLINRLSSLLITLDPLLSLQYFGCFLVTLRREWTGIDHLRLDKFYLLIRRFVNGVFSLMRKYMWDLEYLGKYVEVLEEKGFLANDKLLGNGVNYHVVSVFLDELKGFKVPLARKEVVQCLFKPFFSVMGRSLDKVLVGKVKSCVFDTLLDGGRALLQRKKNGVDEKDGEIGDMLLGLIALKMGFSGRLYEVGASPDCLQGNRKVVLGLHEEFLKLEGEMQASQIDFAIPEFNEVDDNDGEEVPQLIPIDNGVREVVAASQDEDADPVVEKEGNIKKKKKKKGKEAGDKKAKKKKKEKDRVMDYTYRIEENGVVNANCSENCNAGNVYALENANAVSANGYESTSAFKNDESVLEFSESVISNLQLQFEKIAAEQGSDDDLKSSDDLPLVAMKKKRKRAKSADSRCNPEVGTEGEDGLDASAKSAKKVRFAMKNNLIWKPHSPLPPQSLRIPPSLTPRGSALKKGVPPGPIREMPPATKKVKQKKKGRKILRTISPGMKRLKKVRVVSV